MLVPTICASLFKWDNGFGSAKASDLFGTWKAPREFQVKSPKSGKTKQFVYDLEEAIAYDSWDGEFGKYKTDCGLCVKIWNY